MDLIVAKDPLGTCELETVAWLGERDVKVEHGIHRMILKQNHVSVFLCGANRIQVGIAVHRGARIIQNTLRN